MAYNPQEKSVAINNFQAKSHMADWMILIQLFAENSISFVGQLLEFAFSKRKL